MNALRDAWKVFTGLVTLVLAMAVVAWLLNGVMRLAEVMYDNLWHDKLGHPSHVVIYPEEKYLSD